MGRDLDVRPTAAMSGVRRSLRERRGVLENIRISGLIISEIDMDWEPHTKQLDGTKLSTSPQSDFETLANSGFVCYNSIQPRISQIFLGWTLPQPKLLKLCIP